MGKSARGSKSNTEISAMRRLKLENQKLKKQMATLRKQLSRIDIDRYSNLRQIIEAHALEDKGFDAEISLDKLKADWACNECKSDYLRIIVVPRADGTFYMRKCGSCKHRTGLKRFTNNICGLDSKGELFKA